MAFHSTNVMRRERILSFGGASHGKSFDFYTIARMAAKTGSDAVFHVIDTDNSIGANVGEPDLAKHLIDGNGELVNIIPYDVDDWDSLMRAVEEVKKAMRPQDWCMIDMLSPTWEMVQQSFTTKVFSKDLDDYFMEARKAMKPKDKNAQPFEGWKDWPVINSMYSKLQTFILRCPGHVYCTAESKALNFEQAQADTKMIFGQFGVVPVGQKRNPHLFQTVINKRQQPGKPGVYEGVVIKDRGRPDVQHTTMVVKDFALGYLVKHGGWKVA